MRIYADTASLEDIERFDLATIPGLSGYWASVDGTIWSDRGRTAVPAGGNRGGWVRTLEIRKLKAFLNVDGYQVVSVYRDGRKRQERVHRLVAAAFMGESDRIVRHLDGDKTNNARSNLAYGTQAENVQDAVRHGTHRNTAKTHCVRGHLLVGDRDCPECRKIRRRAYYQENGR